MPFERAYDLLEEVATPAEIHELDRGGKVRTEDVDRIRYNQPPPKEEAPKSGKNRNFCHAEGAQSHPKP
jgi:hypothetical protein